ncbi:unnamed protein product [Vitrella brassicaformis CCMP3155]|uniref:C3H1-type domain-containing protein n=1 Tax=Vitrella brassicaformis (strain CCMP3155) TaxID=1169540 RepID=A0A0G4EMT4_VITBC|nr:unnamed protein product [Vitrella brassicaformis CCMP3155]|mmetsp:Transcript_24918/g.61658  ORF Transcript_24918/g.61658 Transcript_24918/m.61658 type:complete len:124 (-) Transcript_24918:1776-2147(-)|eukprot:CEL98481.1 unnamed protein product [Vitrella brassicaformis CCMP3155]
MVYKKAYCILHSKGCCPKGNACNYAHSFNEIDMTKYKINICREWKSIGRCPRGEFCTYAHCRKDMRLEEWCEYVWKGTSCHRGVDCHKAHSDSELKLRKKLYAKPMADAHHIRLSGMTRWPRR